MPYSTDRPSSLRPAWFRAAAVVVAAAGLAAVAGCGSSGPASVPSRAVASIPPTGGHRQSQPAASGHAPSLAGVLLPDNASEAETKRIVDAWSSCLQAHGDPDMGTKADGMRVPEDLSRFPAAVTACRSLQPHPPWQEMPQYNPAYQQDMAAWVDCMNARGVPVTPVPGGWNFNGPSSLSLTKQGQVQTQCEMKAFHEH